MVKHTFFAFMSQNAIALIPTGNIEAESDTLHSFVFICRRSIAHGWCYSDVKGSRFGQLGDFLLDAERLPIPNGVQAFWKWPLQVPSKN